MDPEMDPEMDPKMDPEMDNKQNPKIGGVFQRGGIASSRPRTISPTMNAPERRPDPEVAPTSRSRPRHSSSGPIASVDGWVLFVTGLHPQMREHDLREAFSLHEGIKPSFVRLNVDRKHGTGGKGYAVVEYKKQTQAQDAINQLHGSQLLGKTIGVHWAFVKPNWSGTKRSRPNP
jgi:RNA-binding protein 8A